MADNYEVENKLLRRVLGKLVSAIEIELDAGSIDPTDWEKPIFEEAKLYATRVGVTFQTEAERIRDLEAELTRARAERDAAREALEKLRGVANDVTMSAREISIADNKAEVTYTCLETLAKESQAAAAPMRAQKS